VSVDRGDPARAGVKAGRVVGVLTAGLAVASLLAGRESFHTAAGTLTGLLGVEAAIPVGALFWGNVVLAASARYAVCYVAGSLVGVVYDWLDRPPVAGLTAIVLGVGIVDAGLAFLDTLDAAIAGAHVLAWLVYVPAFVRLFDPGDDTVSEPRRLGEE
jgi:hypothetical protein